MQFKIYKNENITNIIKGTSLKEISGIILNNNNFVEIESYYYYLRFYNLFVNNINFGEFNLKNSNNLIEVTNIISKPSNVLKKILIVDGWQKYQLEEYLSKKFGNTGEKIDINYNLILADTYLYNSSDTINSIMKLIKENRKSFFLKHINNPLFKKFSINEIMTIASLIEKEGIDDYDKKLISSVIFNRLRKKMKLQIDASTIFSITKGNRKFSEVLTFDDLKLKDSYNTYYINDLPPNPICFVSRKTIEIVLEDHKSNYLFYFYDKNIKKHIFSETFDKHKTRLINYRNNEK